MKTSPFSTCHKNKFSVEFTFEIEYKVQLILVDVLVIRNFTNKLQFDMFRKNTHSHGYIPNN